MTQTDIKDLIVLADRHGCGRETRSREELESGMERNLQSSGWDQRAAAIVIDPELEIWMWADSPHVDQALGWRERTPDLNTWLRAQGYLEPGQSKPRRPQEAMDAALRLAGKRRSSAIFQEIATKVSLSRCTDTAFLKLRRTLQNWFPPA